MKINRIAAKGKKDVTIYFDNNITLVLALEIFLKSGLTKGSEIPEDRFSFFGDENKKFLLKQKAFRLLGRRQHSAAELKAKLLNRNYNVNLVDGILKDLIKNGYLNDREFAAAFIEDKIKLQKWSKRKLRAELMKRGLNPELITELMNEKVSDNDNLNSALEVAKKKYDSLKKKKLEISELKNKLTAFLLSRGFDYEIIEEVSGKLIQD